MASFLTGRYGGNPRKASGLQTFDEQGQPIGGDNIADDTGGNVAGSDFVNFSRYFSANKDKAQQMAATQARKLTTQGTDFEKSLAKSKSTFDAGLAAHKATPYGGEEIDAATGQSVTPGTSTNGDLQSQQQGLTGTPNQPTAAPGSITPDEAAARAAQSYTGPTGLGDYADLAGKAQSLDSNATALQSTPGRQAMLADAYRQSLAGKGNALNAALMGTAGQARFAELQKQFGDPQGRLSLAQAKAQDAAKNEGELADAYGKQYRDALGDFNAKKDADTATRAKNHAALQKKQSWDQYKNGGLAAGIESVGAVTSPIDAIWRAAGGGGGTLTPMGAITGGIESQYGAPMGSYKNASSAFQYVAPEWRGKIYDSMTQAELDAFEGMNDAQQKAWLTSRMQMLSQGWDPERDGNF